MTLIEHNMTTTKPSVLIGNTGYVGGTLLRQRHFDRHFNSSNIDQLPLTPCGLVVCSAAPAQKWIANREPSADLDNIQRLISQLNRLDCEQFVLISTVDVFQSSCGVDESSDIDEHDLHPYGLHRRLLEKFVEERFPRHLIIRLPGLVGPDLRKNVIYDLLNNNGVDKIDSRHVFQFYPMINLWFDIEVAIRADLRLVHFTAEPVSVEQVACDGFNRVFQQTVAPSPIRYDMRTLHAELFGGHAGYQYSRRESLQAIRAYAQSELLIEQKLELVNL